MTRFTGCLALSCALALTIGAAQGAAPPQAPMGRPAKQASAFGKFEAPTSDAVKARARAWLNDVGKSGPATDQALADIWAKDRSVLDKVAETFALADADAARALADARGAAVPTAVPAILKDGRKSAFFRSNLALAYARALTQRQVYEEALEVFALVRPEEVVDPSAYFFHKAVSEHGLMLSAEAGRSIDRLLTDVSDAPERHREVAAQMRYDMETWSEKDLAWIARKMENIRRRLDLARGGEKTRRQQREVLDALAKLIDDIERGPRGPRTPRGPGTPGDIIPGGPGSGLPVIPARDSEGGNVTGTGKVDPRFDRFRHIDWGKLPPKERAEAMAELTRTLPARERAVIEAYIRAVSGSGR